ncbi:hypothetical protein cce_4313 [Crocosphaera subtropica ATCC 51142]|uniref:Uncharacterized protein n=2 Tax=Crocosphaera TaxID=263510 RepID=B1WST2_CROS5|nr:hypothetical protein cce_4313 [Crocosphaera subtropica ATCC 51142]
MLLMLYKPLKLMLITATIFVWIRLLAGTVEVFNNPNQSLLDNQTIASESKSYIQR